MPSAPLPFDEPGRLAAHDGLLQNAAASKGLVEGPYSEPWVMADALADP